MNRTRKAYIPRSVCTVNAVGMCGKLKRTCTYMQQRSRVMNPWSDQTIFRCRLQWQNSISDGGIVKEWPMLILIPKRFAIFVCQ